MYVKCEKLVRDKIPEIIQDKNGLPKTRILNKVEYTGELLRKMHEETDEYARDKTVEELADMYEVFCAIVDNSGFKMNQVVARACEKRVTNGAFEKKIYLEGYDYISAN